MVFEKSLPPDWQKCCVGHFKMVTMVTTGGQNIFNVFFNYNLSISTFREKIISIYWSLKKIGLKGLCHLNYVGNRKIIISTVKYIKVTRRFSI